MQRPIIEIDEAKCTGCGQCILDCAEGALAIVDGKARLVSEVFCDGLGACLNCPEGALTLSMREAPEFDEAAALAAKAQRERASGAHACGCGGHGHGEGPGAGHCSGHGEGHGHGHQGCPGSAARLLGTAASGANAATAFGLPGRSGPPAHNLPHDPALAAQLPTWPIQLRLLPPAAPFLKGAHLLLAAHCAGFALPQFHTDWLAGRVPVIACPKLEDNALLLEKLTEILRVAQPASLTVLRMSVPCCAGLDRLAAQALEKADLDLPLRHEVVRLG